MRILPFLFLALSACVAGQTERPLSVKHVVENAEALDGQEIFVTGWIENCDRLSCALYNSADEVGKEWPYFLSVGSTNWFDRYVSRRVPTRVSLRARLHDRCITNPATQIIAACSDRGGSLEPLSFAR